MPKTSRTLSVEAALFGVMIVVSGVAASGQGVIVASTDDASMGYRSAGQTLVINAGEKVWALEGEQLHVVTGPGKFGDYIREKAESRRNLILAKSVKAYERLLDDLRETGERWNQRFCPDEAVLWKSYIDGDFDIVVKIAVFGQGACVDHCFLVRISPYNIATRGNTVGKRLFAKSEVSDVDGWDNEIVLVDLVKLRNQPEVSVPVTARFYRVLEKSLNIGIGEGLLYLAQPSSLGRYEVLPFFVEWERDESGVCAGLANDSRRGIIKRGSKIVDRVAHDQSKGLADICFGRVGDFAIEKIVIGDRKIECKKAASSGGEFAPDDLIEIGTEGRRKRFELLDVMVGPLNL